MSDSRTSFVFITNIPWNYPVHYSSSKTYKYFLQTLLYNGLNQSHSFLLNLLRPTTMYVQSTYFEPYLSVLWSIGSRKKYTKDPPRRIHASNNILGSNTVSHNDVFAFLNCKTADKDTNCDFTESRTRRRLYHRLLSRNAICIFHITHALNIYPHLTQT